MRRLLIALLAVLLAISAIPAKAQYVQGNTFPIIFIHGFSSTSSYDCSGWDTAKSYFSLHGWQGALISIGFYSNDTNCDVSIVNWSALHDSSDHCALDYAGNEGTNNEDLRHVACELAWYLYDNWGIHGWNADIVAHSMGGLITRWMLAASGNSLPPVRYVQDIQTTGTPHGGMQTALPCGCLQAQEMVTSDDFMQALISNGQNPQGSNGTDWTLVGSQCDSNTSLDMAANHKVNYQQPCYTHPHYYDDVTATDDASVLYCNSTECTSGILSVSSTFPHSDHDMLLAMEGLNY